MAAMIQKGDTAFKGGPLYEHRLARHFVLKSTFRDRKKIPRKDRKETQSMPEDVRSNAVIDALIPVLCEQQPGPKDGWATSAILAGGTLEREVESSVSCLAAAGDCREYA